MKTKWFALFLLLAAFAVPTFSQNEHDAKEKPPALGPRAFVDVPPDAVEKTYEALNAAMPVTIVTQMGVTDYLCTAFPGNPPVGKIRFYCDSGTNKLVCIDSTGANACPGGGGGGGSPGGSNGSVQCNVSSSFGACNATDLGGLFTISESLNVIGNGQFKGPNPAVDVTSYGARFLADPMSATTGTCTNGSVNVTLAGAIDFINGDGIVLEKCGAASALGTPGSPSSVNQRAVANGATTRCYEIVAEDFALGLTAASSSTCTATAAAALGAVNIATTTQFSSVSQTLTYTTVTTHNLAPGAVILLGTNGGVFQVVSTPTGTTFTVQNPGTADQTNISQSSSVTVASHIQVYWNSQPNVMRYWIYRQDAGAGNFNLVGVAQGREPFYDDFGWSAPTAPDYVPATAPATATNRSLASRIISGAGTTSLTLADQASNSIGGVTVLHDDSAPIVTALNSAISLGGGRASVPHNTVANTSLHLNFPLVLPVTSNQMKMEFGGTVQANQPIIVPSFYSFFGTQASGAPGSFSKAYTSTITGKGYPLFQMVAGSGQTEFGHLSVTGIQPQQWGMLQDDTFTSTIKDSTFTAATSGSGIVLRGVGFGYNLDNNRCGLQGVSPVFYSQGCFRLMGSSVSVPPSTPGIGIMTNSTFLSAGVKLDTEALNGATAFHIGSPWKFDNIFTESLATPVFDMRNTKGSDWFNWYIGKVYPADAVTNAMIIDMSGAANLTGLHLEDMGGGTGGSNGIITGGGVLWDTGSAFETYILPPGYAATNYRTANLGTNSLTITPRIFESDSGLRLKPGGVVFAELQAPANLSASIAAGGSVPLDTWTYSVSAVGWNGGETAPSNKTAPQIVTTGNQTVNLTWSASGIGTKGYNIYRSNGGGFGRINVSLITVTSFADTFASASQGVQETSSGTGASYLNATEVSTPQLFLPSAGGAFFKAILKAGTLTADRTFTFPDVTGTVALSSGTFNNADCLQGSALAGVLLAIVDAGNPCGSGGSGGATFQVNAVNTSTQTLINFQDATAFNGLTVAFTNPSAGNVKLGLSGTATKALLPATSVYTDQANTFGAFAQDFLTSSLLVPGSAGAAPTTNRSISYDTTANRYTAGLNGANIIFPWFASGTPVNGQCPQWSGTAGLQLAIPCASTANPLSQFAATSSAQLAGVMSDETGTGLLVFATNPVIVTPTIASFTNAQHNHTNAAGGGQITDAAFSTPVGATKGGTGLASIGIHQIAVATATNTFSAKTITDCPDTSGHLNYTQSTDLFSCGTSGVITGLTTNVIPKASSSTSIADSLLTDNGTALSYTGTGGVSATGYSATGSGGFALSGVEGVAPSGLPGSDIIWADSTAHRFKANNNNGGATTVAMFSDPLSVFATTTSAQLAGVVSDEVGSGALMFSPKQDIMDAASFCADAGASGTTYTCSLTPAISAYVTGTHYRFKANTANSGSSTINFNSLGAKTIVKAAGGITTVLVANDMRAGQWVDLIYDGTNMQMQSTSGNAIAGAGTVTSVALTVPAFLSVSGSPITSNGTFAVTLANENANTIFSGPCSGAAAAPTFRAMCPADVVLGVNAQTSAGYTVLTGDQGKLVTVSNSAPQTLTLPSSAPASGWWIAVENTGTGTWTVSRNGLNIDGAASNFNLTTNQGVLIYSDGSNYFTERGVGGAGGGSVTTTGSPASGNLTKFSGATSITNGDLAGDVTTSGTLTATLANIPTGVPMAGSILSTEIAAPSSPAAGKDSLYTDSTDLRFHDKNASGVIGTTVVADTGSSNNFLTAISAAGAISKAQPTFANLAAGTVAAKAIFPGGDFFNGGIDAQVGTSYTIAAADENKLLTFSNGSATAVTLPQATTAGFTVGAIFAVTNLGAGAVTITPTTSTINGNATVVLNQNQGAFIVSDGTNYSAWVSAAPSGSGTVTSVAESFTGGLISVGGSPVTTSGTLALTVAGTSGGIVCFTGASTWASSALLTANNVMLGGGAATCPTVTATDTTTTHALFATAGAPAFRAIVAGDLPNIPLQQVISPTGAVATFADGDNPIVFNSASSTSGRVAFTIGETTASTAASTAKLFLVQTSNTSTAVPFTVTQGTGVNATDNVLALSVTGGVGGANAGATSAGKLGGGITLTTGAGSAAGATSGTGGAGGDVNLTAGNGGAAAVGSTTGKGGDIIFTPGTAGTTGTVGAAGQVKMPFATVGAALATPFVNITGTWNTTGVVDAAIFANITNTASGAASKLIDLQIGGVSEFSVDKTGVGLFNSSVTTTGSTAGALLCTAGAANGHATVSTVTTECPSSVTAYESLVPSAAASGVVSNSNSSSVVTETYSGDANHATHSTGQTATKTIYTLCPASAGGCNVAGQYMIDWYFNQGGTACGTPGTGGVTFALSWTDNAGAHSAVALPMDDSSSLTATGTKFTFQAANTSAWASGHFVIWSTGAQPIQITNTYTACSVGTGTWELAATAVQLQ